MANTTDIYTSYHAMSTEITEGLSQMAKICEKLDLKERAESLMESRRKLQEHKFSVGILGEFKRGKSTVINALLGQEIMPADITPCSATMNRVTYGLSPRAQVNMMDGSHVDIAVEDLAKYVTKLDEDAIAMSEKVEEAIVYYPCQFCQNGVDIVDTPGLNDDERMNKITENIVPGLDAVIMVLVADNPFSISEAEFVRNKLMCSDVGRLIFLVNKIDTVRPKDRDKAINGIREKIKKTVLDKTEDVYGKESDQYRVVQAKLADIRIFPISAINALDGRIEGDTELLQKSGMLDFEAALSHMLTTERGVLELSTPIMKLMSMAPVVNDTITQRINSMDVDQETFVEAQKKAIQEIKSFKDQKILEKEALATRAQNLQVALSGKAEQCYQEIEEEATRIVNQIEPSGTLNESEKMTLLSETAKKIEKRIDEIMAIHAERLVAELNEAIQKEGETLSINLIQNGASKISQHLDNVTLKKKTNAWKDSTKDGVAEMAAIYLPILAGIPIPVFGVGAALSGYRNAGAKGLMVGGASGLAVGFASFAAFSALGIVGLPLGILCAATSTLGGSKIVNTLFKKDVQKKQVQELRQALNCEILKAIQQIRLSQVLEKWIQTEVGSQYERLLNTMEKECDNVINEAQRKIAGISQIVTAQKAEKEAQRNVLIELNDDTSLLLKKLEPVYRKILDVPTMAAV